MRVTQNVIFQSLLSRTGSVFARMVRIQEQLGSGKKIQRPSDDPRILSKSLSLRSDLRELEAYQDNASSATAFMSLTEGTLGEVSNLLSRAKEVVLAGMDDTSEVGGIDSLVLELRSIVDSLLLVANREIAGRRIFAGRETRTVPYTSQGGRIVYQGDEEDILEEISPGLRVAINLTGPAVFETVPSQITGAVDLDPAVSAITPLADLLGGQGVSPGRIRITDSNGVSADIDLLGATNVGHVLDGINDAGLSVVASLGADGKTIELTDTGGGTTLSVEDLDGGSLASGFGIATTSDTGSITGIDLDPALTENTATALLLGGAGIGSGTWTLRNDGRVVQRQAAIDPSGANTVGDLLAMIESATTSAGQPLGIRASLESGKIVLESTRLHTTLTVSDGAGSASAQDLGLAGTGEVLDLFELMEQAAQAIEARDHDAMEEILRRVSAAIEGTAAVRGTYGARARQVLGLAENLRDQTVDLTIRLSDVEDVDFARAALELTQAETVYNASLAAGRRLFDVSLFDFIR